MFPWLFCALISALFRLVASGVRRDSQPNRRCFVYRAYAEVLPSPDDTNLEIVHTTKVYCTAVIWTLTSLLAKLGLKTLTAAASRCGDARDLHTQQTNVNNYMRGLSDQHCAPRYMRTSIVATDLRSCRSTITP